MLKKKPNKDAGKPMIQHKPGVKKPFGAAFMPKPFGEAMTPKPYGPRKLY